MKILSFFIFFIIFLSCNGKEDYLTLDIYYNKFDSIISFKYTNNTNDNLFFISPNFSICQLKLDDNNQYVSSSISPCITEYSLIKDSSKYYSPFITVIKENYLKYFSKIKTDENIENLINNNNNAIIILQKGEIYTQYIKIKSLPASGIYKVDFINISDYLENLKQQKDPYYNFFKSLEEISYKNYLYYNRDFIIKNNRFIL